MVPAAVKGGRFSSIGDLERLFRHTPGASHHVIRYLTYAEYSGNSNLKAGRDLKDHCFKGEEISNLPPLQLSTLTSLGACTLPSLTKEKTKKPDVTGDSECVPQAERDRDPILLPRKYIFGETILLESK